ncbi:MAG: S41 family peptidase [Heyndrickxia sp.]
MYKAIFQEIVSICHHDYSGCEDKKGWDNPDLYAKAIQVLEDKNELTPAKFAEIVQDYLLDFKDHHMFFKLITNETQKQYDIGFKVRRYHDRLYITSVGEEKRVQKGHAIISLENTSIPELQETHKRRLAENSAEREKWEPIIGLYSYCEVEDRNGQKYSLKLDKYEKEKYIPNYSIQKLEDDVLLLTITDFNSPDSINQLIESYQEELGKCKNLIIDVRVNLGGSDSSYFRLIPYLFPKGIIDLESEEDGIMTFNCTDRNYELETVEVKKMIAQTEDENFKNVLSICLREWEKNKGKGFSEFDFSDVQEKIELEGKNYPEHIIVLSGVTCGSAGDSFVETCKKSSKVKVIGRPTLGVNDYANLTIMSWEGLFELWYPTSRLSRIDEGRGMTGVGITPQVYIPWTPEHIFEDVDMNMALEMLKEAASEKI